MKKNGKAEFALCLNNEGYPASLQIGKLYRIVPDKDASAEGYLRVVDEFGEDYAFAADRFYILDLPTTVKKALSSELQTA